jgi:hypothetical protein
MSLTRSKVVELKGEVFEVRKLAPDVGSFIFMRMMSISMRMMQELAEKEAEAAARKQSAQTPQEAPKPEEEAAPDSQISGEMRVRALAFTVLSGGVSFEDFQFIQTACLKATSKKNDSGLFMPIMTDGGVWTKDGDLVRDDVGVAMQVVSEVLIFCFSSFFESSVPGM